MGAGRVTCCVVELKYERSGIFIERKKQGLNASRAGLLACLLAEEESSLRVCPLSVLQPQFSLLAQLVGKAGGRQTRGIAGTSPSTLR